MYNRSNIHNLKFITGLPTGRWQWKIPKRYNNFLLVYACSYMWCEHIALTNNQIVYINWYTLLLILALHCFVKNNMQFVFNITLLRCPYICAPLPEKTCTTQLITCSYIYIYITFMKTLLQDSVLSCILTQGPIGLKKPW